MTSDKQNKIDLATFVPYVLNRITNLLNLDMKEALRKLNLTVPRWRVLAVLIVEDGKSIGEIARGTALEPVAASRVVAQMEQENLVERKANQKDNRYTDVFLTERGRKVYEALYPMAIRNQQHALEGLDKNDIDQLLRVCYRILENLDKGARVHLLQVE